MASQFSLFTHMDQKYYLSNQLSDELQRMSYDVQNLALPGEMANKLITYCYSIEIKWIGIHTKDFGLMPSSALLPMTEEDISFGKAMLNRTDLDPRWRYARVNFELKGTEQNYSKC